MSLIYEFIEISTYLIEEDDHTITACTEIDGETIEKPVKSNICWGPNKADTLDQLISENRLDYDFTETHFMLTDTAPLAKETPMNDEDHEIDLFEMFQIAKGRNFKLTLTDQKLIGFTLYSKASTDLANLDIIHEERMLMIEGEREIARAKTNEELDVGLSTIRTETMMQAALNKEKNSREIWELTISVETDIKKQRIEVEELKQRLMQETHCMQIASERLKVQTKYELSKLRLETMQS